MYSRSGALMIRKGTVFQRLGKLTKITTETAIEDGVIKYFSKFTRKHRRRSLFINKIADLSSAKKN